MTATLGAPSGPTYGSGPQPPSSSASSNAPTTARAKRTMMGPLPAEGRTHHKRTYLAGGGIFSFRPNRAILAEVDTAVRPLLTRRVAGLGAALSTSPPVLFSPS